MSEKNNCLYQRSKILAKYAEYVPEKMDSVDIQLDPPDAGWIDIHILVNGEEKEVVCASNVYEPFSDIREWLENIVTHIFEFTPSGVNIDCEGYNVLLYYDPILYQTDEMLFDCDAEPCGIFYLYDGYKQKCFADALCNTKDFVKAFYSRIIEYANEMHGRGDFFDKWIEGAYNGELSDSDEAFPEDHDLFLKNVTSKVIEDFLANENSTRRFVRIM